MKQEKVLPTSQMQAAKDGSKRYQGTPCPHGHSGIRYTRNGSCVDCVAAASKARLLLIREILDGNDA